MGNQHSASRAAPRTRKNVHWKSAGRPAAPGKPDIVPILSDDEPDAVCLRWAPPAHDGGAPLRGYRVECNRLGSADWARTAPPVVRRPELVLTGLEPPHRYRFRVAALNAAGRSDYGELSDVLAVGAERASREPPRFLRGLEDVTALENDETEFRVAFSGLPPPAVAWFKDDYEIFSSRRTAISTGERSSVLVFHQTLPGDEGEIKCTATNRAGHATSRARLRLEAPPALRYPRRYEDGLLYEVGETVVLATTVVGEPAPAVEWSHDGRPLVGDDRVLIATAARSSTLKITSARRSDRGEYRVRARNRIGEDAAAFLVTVTAPPDPPAAVAVARQADGSVTLAWRPPEDDGGCRVGNYVVEYYRSGWDVWLKATASRGTTATLFDLIEGSEYRFRVKAESPYGTSAPSAESAPIRIPGKSVDMDFLAVESRMMNDANVRREGEVASASPIPRRRRAPAPAPLRSPGASPRAGHSPGASPRASPRAIPSPGASPRALPSPGASPRAVPPAPPGEATSNEFMLVLYPQNTKSEDKTEKRKSFQLDLEDALSPPPLSLSAPELRPGAALPFKALRNAVSSTELLHERAMARFYKAVALEEQNKQKHEKTPQREPNHIPYVNDVACDGFDRRVDITRDTIDKPQMPDVLIGSDSLEDKVKPSAPALRKSESLERWQQMSFDEDYTASTVSTDGDCTDDEEGDSLTEDAGRGNRLDEEEETYNPRNKTARPQPLNERIEEDDEELERELLKPLPLVDPDFVPKPILKKRDLDEVDNKNLELNKNLEKRLADKQVTRKQNREGKNTIFKKISKQNPFNFTKILSKQDSDKSTDVLPQVREDKSMKSVDTVDDKYSDEGRSVIDYYGNIVKEYGSQKKSNTPLYLKTEDLKQVAEQQINTVSKNDEKETKKIVKSKKIVLEKISENKVKCVKKKKVPKEKQEKEVQRHQIRDKQTEGRAEKKTTQLLSKSIEQNKSQKPHMNTSQNTRVLLKTTERATVVIPIDYKTLEERAKVNVRSAIDYTVDVCLLLLAFWIYFFKDERLAIPFLILIIYRQLQETFLKNVPEWFRRSTPRWLKKTS